jgi:hypothetical protein
MGVSEISRGPQYKMTENGPATTTPRGRGQDIIINGKVWRPRYRIALENVGCSDKTLKKKNPKTALITGMAYCPVDETLEVLVADAQRPNQPDEQPRPPSKRSASRDR